MGCQEPSLEGGERATHPTAKGPTRGARSPTQPGQLPRAASRLARTGEESGGFAQRAITSPSPSRVRLYAFGDGTKARPPPRQGSCIMDGMGWDELK